MDNQNKQKTTQDDKKRKNEFSDYRAIKTLNNNLRKRLAFTHSFRAESAEEPIPGAVTEQEGSIQQETLTFLDNQVIKILDMGNNADSTRTRADFQGSNSLGEFLSRPVNISSLSWTPGTTFETPNGFIDIKPWELLAQSYLPKIQNFRLFRCKSLRLQVRINGSPFHYGRLYCSYFPGRYSVPYSGMGTPINTTVAPTNYGAFNATNEPLKTHWSQYPGIFVDPSTNDVMEFDLPFFWPNDYLSLVADDTATNFEDMGTLKIWELTPLRHSNGATDTISLTISAWFVDPVLTMPTVVTPFSGESADIPRKQSRNKGPAPGNTENRTKRAKDREKVVTPVKQGVSHNSPDKSSGNDEYGKGAVSAPASALANFAGTLEKVPMIGPYATATKVAASGIAKIAKLFGYSRPAIVDNQQNVTVRPFGSLANTTGDEPLFKLSLDPKQEVTIDPVVTGLHDMDEMSFAYLFKRESLIVQVPWLSTTTRGTNLVNIAVHPQVCPTHISTQLIRFNTALSWATYPFLYWRGSLNYRLQIVASQMHRGRLAIVYQPVKHAGATNPGSHISYTQYMDLTECRDITFTVRYTHYAPYLAMHLANPTFINSGAPSFNALISGQTNGILSVFVLNELGAPVDTSEVSINVFVSAGDDFMVAAPGAVALEEFSPFAAELREAYTAESGEYVAESADYTVDHENLSHLEPSSSVLNGENDTVPDVDNESIVFFGEQIVSLRALLKRYCYYRPLIMDTTAMSNTTEFNVFNPTMPVMRGPSGTDESLLGNWGMGNQDANGSYNYVQTTLLTYYKYGYAAWRGSIRYKFIIDKQQSPQAGSALYVSRDGASKFTTNQFIMTHDSSVTLTSASTMDERLITFLPNIPPQTYAGTDVTYIRQKNGIEFEMPYYFNQRFIWNRLPAPTSTNSADPNDSYYQQHYSTAHATSKILTFGSAGDFNTNPFLSSLWTATGEDFGLHFFLAAPVMAYTIPLAPGP